MQVSNAMRLAFLVAVISCTVAAPGISPAASWIENRFVSFDTTLETEAGIVRDNQILVKAWQQAPVIRTLGLPEGVQVAAFAVQSGDNYYASDISYDMSGQLVTPRDIVRRTATGVATIFLSGSSIGLPPATRISSLAFSGAGVLFTLDTAATIGSLNTKPSDILVWNGSTVNVAYSGIFTGIPEGNSITGLEHLSSGRLLITLSTHADMGGVRSTPGDILEYDPISGQWDINRASTRLGVTCQPCKITALAADAPLGSIFRSGLESLED